LLKQCQELLFSGTVRLARRSRWVAKIVVGKLCEHAGAGDTTLAGGAGAWLATGQAQSNGWLCSAALGTASCVVDGAAPRTLERATIEVVVALQ
jgi:hypothetical protein